MMCTQNLSDKSNRTKNLLNLHYQYHDCWSLHYSDVIMSVMASQITSLTIVYFTVYSGRSKETSQLRVTGLCVGNSPVTGEFPTQRASNAKNVSIWWCHHVADTGSQSIWHGIDIFLLEYSFLTPEGLKFFNSLTFSAYPGLFFCQVAMPLAFIIEYFQHLK